MVTGFGHEKETGVGILNKNQNKKNKKNQN